MITCPHIDNLKLSTFKTCYARKKKAKDQYAGIKLSLSGFWKELQICARCNWPEECEDWRITA